MGYGVIDMALALVERFEVDGRRYSLYEGERWLLFREHSGGAVCVGSIIKSGLGFIVSAWAKPGPMIIVQTLEAAIEHLLITDAPPIADDEEDVDDKVDELDEEDPHPERWRRALRAPRAMA
ncbi:Zn-dependent protease [Leifsonia sp. EB41]